MLPGSAILRLAQAKDVSMHRCWLTIANRGRVYKAVLRQLPLGQLPTFAVIITRRRVFPSRR